MDGQEFGPAPARAQVCLARNRSAPEQFFTTSLVA